VITDAILHQAPVAPVRLNPDVPAELERIINKAIEKDRELRYKHASDLGVDLKRLRRELDSGRTSAVNAAVQIAETRLTTATLRPSLKILAPIALVALVAAGTLAWLFRPTLAPPRVTGFTQLTHDGWQKNSFGQTAPTVLTDGARLYVQETVHGRFVVAQVSASGGDAVPIDTPFPNTALDNLSPDRSELIVGSFTGSEIDQPLYALPTTGGAPRRLGDLQGQDAIWMPNGDLLISHASELSQVSSGSERLFLKLPDQNSTAYWLRWSPDHQVLRFTLAPPAKNFLAEVSADGKRYRRFLEQWHLDDDVSSGNWTPDGKLFVFQTLHNWGRADIWAIREKGDLFHRVSPEPIQLTAGPLSFYAPQPSLDGKKIYVIGEQPRSELVRYDAKSRQFVPYLNGISARAVSFSRDGQWVTYVSYPEGNLWRCRVDGSEKLQLTSAPFFVNSATWSPSGRELAFWGSQPGAEVQLYLVAAEGGSLRELRVAKFNVGAASWSSDGSSIIFNDTVNAGASTLRSVDLKTMTTTAIPGSDNLVGLASSPDGRYLAATTVLGDKLVLFDFSTQKWADLAKTRIGSLNWSSDGKFVVFDNGFTAEPAVYRVRLADRKVEQIASLKDFRRVVIPLSTWFGVTPNGDVLLMHDTGSQEVYALDLEIP
jgi:Tol biopolymer transport system component